MTRVQHGPWNSDSRIRSKREGNEKSAKRALSVLLVEDDPDHARLIEEHLALISGIEIAHHSMNLGDAIRTLRSERTDVVLLDLCLPDAQDFTSVEKVAEIAPMVPIIAMSSSRLDHDGRESVRGNADDFIDKSDLTPQLLVRSIKCALESAKRRDLEMTLGMRESELEAVREVQHEMLPDESPDLDEFEIAGVSRPADTFGGDFYDFRPINEDAFGVVIGDARRDDGPSGGGAESTMMMTQVCGMLRGMFEVFNDPRQIMGTVNKALGHDFLQTGQTVSAMVLRLDPETYQLSWTGAGSVKGLLFDNKGQLRKTLDASPVALGADPYGRFPDCEPVTIGVDETVVLLTDGILEAANRYDVALSEQKLIQFIAQRHHLAASRIAGDLISAVGKFCRDNPQADDMTALVIKRFDPNAPKEGAYFVE